MKNFIVVIPARLESTRLPEKPLIQIMGKSVIQRTYEQCLKAVDKNLIYVATDSDKIYDHCISLGIQTIMTSKDVLTGTDRVCEVSTKIKAKYYINVQGDEPVFNPEDLKGIIKEIDLESSTIINGYTAIQKEEDYLSRSTPKVVVNLKGNLLYMSRSPIPGNKTGSFEKAWRQVCIYAFPYKALKEFNSMRKTPLEEIEDIEILRFIELGYKVKMIEMSSQSIPVDVRHDIFKVEEYLKKNFRKS
jgi:3-deoxy-manno-octulosonate cytidylyltransferase (CMP-KDO synthetase)